jgi:hypothetical protein
MMIIGNIATAGEPGSEKASYSGSVLPIDFHALHERVRHAPH